MRTRTLEMETYQHVEPLSTVLGELLVSLRSSLKHEENGNGVSHVWGGGGVQTPRRALGYPCCVCEGEKRGIERNEGQRDAKLTFIQVKTHTDVHIRKVQLFG